MRECKVCGEIHDLIQREDGLYCPAHDPEGDQQDPNGGHHATMPIPPFT